MSHGSNLFDTGTGKTTVVRELLRSMDQETMQHTTISLNSFTDAPFLQTILEQPLEKNSGLIPSLVLNSGLEKQASLRKGSNCNPSLIVPKWCTRDLKWLVMGIRRTASEKCKLQEPNMGLPDQSA